MRVETQKRCWNVELGICWANGRWNMESYMLTAATEAAAIKRATAIALDEAKEAPQCVSGTFVYSVNECEGADDAA